jgi:hypothetical protein
MKTNALKKLGILSAAVAVPALALVPLASLGALTACGGWWTGTGAGNGAGGGASGGLEVWTCTCQCQASSCDVGNSCITNPSVQYCGSNAIQEAADCSTYCGGTPDPYVGGVSCFVASNFPQAVTMCPAGSQAEMLHWGDPQTTDATLDSTRSTATVTYYGQNTVVPVAGTMEFTGGCATGACSISFNQITLAPSNFTVTDANGVPTTLTNVSVVNVGTVVGTQDSGRFTIPYQNLLLNVSAEVNGVLQAVQISPAQNLEGSYSPSTGSFTLLGDILGATGFGLTFSLVNATISRPPVASAGPALSFTIPPSASSATAWLEGTASSDPDGNLGHLDWYEGATYLGSGLALEYTFPLGQHTVTAVAWDTTAKWNAATTTVTVEHFHLSR